MKEFQEGIVILTSLFALFKDGPFPSFEARPPWPFVYDWFFLSMAIQAAIFAGKKHRSQSFWGPPLSRAIGLWREAGMLNSARLGPKRNQILSQIKPMKAPGPFLEAGLGRGKLALAMTLLVCYVREGGKNYQN